MGNAHDEASSCQCFFARYNPQIALILCYLPVVFRKMRQRPERKTFVRVFSIATEEGIYSRPTGVAIFTFWTRQCTGRMSASWGVGLWNGDGKLNCRIAPDHGPSGSWLQRDADRYR
jgi:hypothetical protein